MCHYQSDYTSISQITPSSVRLHFISQITPTSVYTSISHAYVIVHNLNCNVLLLVIIVSYFSHILPPSIVIYCHQAQCSVIAHHSHCTSVIIHYFHSYYATLSIHCLFIFFFIISAQAGDEKKLKSKTTKVTQTRDELKEKLHEHLNQLKGSL